MLDGGGGSDGVVIGVDISGTKTHTAAFDCEFNQVAQHQVPTVTGGTEPVSAAALGAVAELTSGLNGSQITHIGVGVPGVVSPEAGTVRQAVNLGIGDEPLGLPGQLAAVYAVPCVIENDLNVAAMGAFHLLGDRHEITDLACLSIGTGIAVGIILNGRLHRGQRGVAGEIGHLPLRADGPLRECGLRGCLEARSRFLRSLNLPARVPLEPDGPVGSLGAAILARPGSPT